MPVPRSATNARARAWLLPFALVLCGLALVRSVLSVWFTSEVVATPPSTELAAARLSKRVLLIVVDGLRYDTALESGAMPKLAALARRESSGECWASHVTMTGLGVRTLGTGSSPSLADLLQNAKLPPVTFDNVFAALRRRGGHVAWLGNSSWKELFGAYIDIDPGVSRLLDIVSKANPVYPADAIIVARSLALMKRSDWELAIIHVGGLDNASHMWTPFGAHFLEKARAVDDDLERMVAAAGHDTTILITSDHGTSAAGHHGSGEPIARRTPLVLLGPGIRSGGRFEAEQTDVAPTLAVLLGLPFPAPSEGRALLEALDVTPEVASAIAQANARQHQRYADAFARAHQLPAPEISPARLRRLGEWLEETRSGASLVPLAWAGVLALLAVSIVLGSCGARASLAWTIAALAGALAAFDVGRAGLISVVAVVASAGAALPARARFARLSWTPLFGLLALCLLELSMLEWKLHHRFVEIEANAVYHALHLSDQGFAVLASALAVALGALLLRRQRTLLEGSTRVGALLALTALAACGDALTLPVAIGAGALLLLALGLRGVADTSSFLKGARRRTLAFLGALALALVVVRALGSPQLIYRVTLLLGGLAALVFARLEREHRRLETLGWAAALFLLALSRPAQAPGVVACTLLAAWAGRSVAALRARASAEATMLAATVLCVAVRMGFFALFEGAFEISRLELWLAYQGNPGAELGFGTLIVTLKFALPWLLGFCFVCGRLAASELWQVVAWTGAFLCLRVAHIVCAMTAARGTFYSPFLDSGQLALTLATLATLPIAIALAALPTLFQAAAREPSVRTAPQVNTSSNSPATAKLVP